MDFINDSNRESEYISNFEMSHEQNLAFQKFKDGENLFITGPGGSGKSMFIREIMKYSQTLGKKIQICAMTGCAAVLLECNAKTIHSWSG